MMPDLLIKIFSKVVVKILVKMLAIFIGLITMSFEIRSDSNTVMQDLPGLLNFASVPGTAAARINKETSSRQLRAPKQFCAGLLQC